MIFTRGENRGSARFAPGVFGFESRAALLFEQLVGSLHFWRQVLRSRP